MINEWGDIITEAQKKICFAILVHENRELVRQLIDNIQYYCPNSLIVLYNGGSDHSLCDELNIPVCPYSKKLKYGYTTIHMIEVMEWLEEVSMNYDYFINIDSDALFIRHGYEEFIQEEMKNADYMAVDFRITGKDYYCGQQIKKDKERWKKFFKLNPLYGVFNVGQVMSKHFVNFLLSYHEKDALKKALLQTPAFGTDEIVFVNLAVENGFVAKMYPPNEINPKYKTIGWDMHNLLIRYRPYISITEIIRCLNDYHNIYLCHPIYRSNNDPARQLINTLQELKQHKHSLYEPYQSFFKSHPSFSPSQIIQTGLLELVARSNDELTHFYELDNKWLASDTFTKGVEGQPLLILSNYENYGNFEVICKLKDGGIAHWYRDNTLPNLPWIGPVIISHENVQPILLTQLSDKKLCFVGRMNNRIIHWIRDDYKWKWYQI